MKKIIILFYLVVGTFLASIICHNHQESGLNNKSVKTQAGCEMEIPDRDFRSQTKQP